MRNYSFKSLAYNGSGYYDETAFKAIKNVEEKKVMEKDRPKKGEIWEVEASDGRGREVLVLAAHDTFATILTLVDQPSAECIEVKSRSLKYTEAGKIGYFFYRSPRIFIKSLPDDEMNDIMQAVLGALGVRVRVKAAKSEGTLNKRNGLAAEEVQTQLFEAQDQLAKKQSQLLKMQIEKAEIKRERDI